jgi:hypothetical protein
MQDLNTGEQKKQHARTAELKSTLPCTQERRKGQGNKEKEKDGGKGGKVKKEEGQHQEYFACSTVTGKKIPPTNFRNNDHARMRQRKSARTRTQERKKERRTTVGEKESSKRIVRSKITKKGNQRKEKR